MLKFTAKDDVDLVRLILKKAELKELGEIYGSPLNILLPHRMDENIKEFAAVLDKYQLSGKIHFAHKCNKSTALVRRAKLNGIKIDVASAEELKHALINGFRGEEIEVTGPKNPELMRLGLMQGVTFNVDNLEELNQLERLALMLKLAEPVKILLRLSNFNNPRKQVIPKPSRFGVPVEQFTKFLDEIPKLTKLELIGLSFHLDTTALEEKLVAVEQCLKLFEKCYETGLYPRALDIGGGFPINYLTSKEEWDDSLSEIREQIMANTPPTWDGGKFGLRAEHGKLVGKLSTANYYSKEAKAENLETLLEASLPDFGDRKVAEILRENEIELWLEPGKALLDNVGLTLARINFVKDGPKAERLVGIDMNRSNFVMDRQETLIDPILLSDEMENSANYFIIGNLCMENDLIFNRTINLTKTPKAGDWLLFPNTAAYSMDFSESETIMHPVAKKIILDKNLKMVGSDEAYNPYREAL